MRTRRAQSVEQDSRSLEDRQILVQEMVDYFESVEDLAYWVVTEVMNDQQVDSTLDDMLTMAAFKAVFDT